MQNVTEELRTALADRYVIESELGEGGMATVYLAHDVKHDRKVALKVLRPELAAVIGADRFLAEIKTTANLQHPHILPLHDSGEADGFLYYVMPYVEGESLRDRLEREKQLPVDAAVRIVREVADALDYAHRREVIHRDIKPENILLHDGRAMVADFGIALAVTSAGSSRMTETGMSLGTPNYMSPEQAMGERELSPASDVYALGAVLYELLAGEPPFGGPTAQAIVARVVTETPRALTVQRHTVPPHVEAATMTALEKLPADRFATAAQFAEALATPGYAGATTSSSLPVPGARRPNRTTVAAIAVGVVAIVLWVGSLVTGPTLPRSAVDRQQVTLFSGQLDEWAVAFEVALAPDGSAMVFSDTAGGDRQLWLKERDRAAAVPVPGTEGAYGPFFSPDGGWIGFFADEKMWKVPRRGGSAVALADAANTENARSAAWLTDGAIVFNHGWALYRVPESGGQAELLLEPTPEDTGDFDSWITGVRPILSNRGVLITTFDRRESAFAFFVFDFAEGELRQVADRAAVAWHTPFGHVLYVRDDGGVFAMPFDDRSLQVTGEAIPVLSGVRMTRFGYPDAVLGVDGTLLYVSGEPLYGDLLRPVWVDRRGEASPVDSTWTIVQGAWAPGVALSPDDRQAAVTHAGGEAMDLYVKELDRGPFTRLTFDGAINTRPAWSGDGSTVWFISDRDGGERLWSKRADGSTEAVLFDVPVEDEVNEVVLSADGDPAIIRVGSFEGRDLVRLLEDDSVEVLLAEEHEEVSPTLSPDGNWVAYVSDESGRFEVYVRPFPEVSASRQQLSKDGGTEPLWSHSGREIFYVNGDGFMVAARVLTDPRFRIEGETVLFPAMGPRDVAHRTYDVTRDDQRFLMLVQEERAEARDKLILVRNWFTELGEMLGE
jgi:serine/threonine-protein kinase